MTELVLERLPLTLAEFEAMPQMDLRLPQNTAAMFLLAVNAFVQDRKTGRQMLDLLRGPAPLSAYEESFLYDRIRYKPYLPLAYFCGAAPGNNYTPALPLTLQVWPDTRPQAQPGYIRLFLATAGADDMRPMTLRQKGENWYLWEYSSILLGVRPPEKEDPWA